MRRILVVDDDLHTRLAIRATAAMRRSPLRRPEERRTFGDLRGRSLRANQNQAHVDCD